MSSGFNTICPKGNTSKLLGYPFTTGLISHKTGAVTAFFLNHRSIELTNTP